MSMQIALPMAGHTLGVLNLLQALAQRGAVLVLDARLVCGDGVVVPLEPVQRRALARVALRPCGVHVSALDTTSVKSRR